jgi:hypothetical protein
VTDEARRDWEPWGTRAAAQTSSNESSLMASAFSRLSYSAISGGGSAVHLPPPSPAPTQSDRSAPGNQVVTPTNPPSQDPPQNNAPPKPTPPSPNQAPPTLGPAPLPPDPGGSTPQPSPGPTAAPNPTDPFHSHDTPPPSAFVPPAPHGPLGPNDPPGGLLPTGGTPAHSPEPGSMLLLATGLVVAFGELRRRRVL